MKLVHVVQHTSAEYLGLIEDHLEGRSVRFRYCRPFTGKVPLPKPEALDDGLILLGGGPWGSAGARDVPTLEAEIALAKACLEQHKPLVGIGLGAQILALAAGGRSQPTPLEFSVISARRTTERALNGYLPAQYPLAIYMRDWPLPPTHAEVLAVDETGRAALWQVGNRAFGFAGHPGIKVAMAEDLIMEFEEGPQNVAAGLSELRAAQRAIEDALVPIMTGLVQRTGWIEPG
ncbi:MAG TPA: gamma-glutamyl-gamma-aminobutyrate hydrolase family protein [Burkholderiales bacterium]|nr:gamma-glutamyl-gamma-aminobutyrate hydrolase family protein [Burkholderiales bacterium]